MAFPDAGHPEEYTEAQMNELLRQFDTDKSGLTKNQKAAVARYNFKKNKGEAITFRPPGSEAPAAAEAPKEAPKPAPEAKPAAPAKKEKPAEEIAREKAMVVPLAKEALERFRDGLDLGWQTKYPYLVVTKAETFLPLCAWLRDEKGFSFFNFMTATDWPPNRIDVLWNLYNPETHEGVAVKVAVPRELETGDLPTAPSIVPLFRGADWYEREVFDLFGVQFDGHPDMRRIMLPEGWTGYPLRKDYDVTKEQYVALGDDGEDIVSFKEEEGW